MTQRLLIEITRGPLKGQSYSMRESDTLLVGRLPECGISIPQDPTVSRQQFRIEYRDPNFVLVHLSQTSETLVNETSAQTVELHYGDRIQFGASNQFQIALDEAGDEPLMAATQTRLNKFAIPMTYTTTPLSCGWNLYQGQEAEFDCGHLIEFLNRSSLVLAVIDFRRMNKPISPDLVDPSYLFPWLDDERVQHFSPIVTSISGDYAGLGVIRENWGRDGIICFASKLNREEVIRHWRTAVGVVDDKPGPAMNAYFWPSILKMMLQTQQKAALEPFLSNLTWIMVESKDSPSQWNLYADAGFEKTLEAAGFARVEKKS